MSLAMNPERRSVLFEMLRRQNISETSKTTQEERISAEKKAAREAEEARDFLAAALRSWDYPYEDAENAAEAVSAPEPRGNNEFLRAVGA